MTIVEAHRKITGMIVDLESAGCLKIMFEMGIAMSVFTAVWIILPGIYNPRPISLATDAVCNMTHKPPKAKKSEHRIKRSDSSDISSRRMHPLDSSKIPESITGKKEPYP